MTCSFALPKTVNLTVFYSRITLNVPLSQLFTVFMETFQLTVFHCSIFTVFYH